MEFLLNGCYTSWLFNSHFRIPNSIHVRLTMPAFICVSSVVPYMTTLAIAVVHYPRALSFPALRFHSYHSSTGNGVQQCKHQEPEDRS